MQQPQQQPQMFALGNEILGEMKQQQVGGDKNMGINNSQLFAKQLLNQNHAMMQQPQQLGMLQGMTPTNMDENYMIGHNMDILQEQQQVQAQTHQHMKLNQLQQNQGQQPMGPMQKLNMNMSSLPPGMNVMPQQQQQQPNINMNIPDNNNNYMPYPKQMLSINGNNGLPPMVILPPSYLTIREVWSNNLYSEFVTIRKLLTRYNHIAISTEFAGTIARPIGNFRSKTDYHYQTMRSNVDLLNPIQVGISLSDENGNKPENESSTWQFNFKFDISNEMISADSLELLKKSGIDFESHQKQGINTFDFAQLMMDSGLVLDNDMTWVTFHAAYDFGFLVHLLMDDSMPNNMQEFQWWVNKLVPNFYDLNLLYKVIKEFKQQQQQLQQQQQITLASLADELGIPRFPLFNTTGGQSLLALLAFSQLGNVSKHKLPNGTDFAAYHNLIHGINAE